jgi:hypothetical protein
VGELYLILELPSPAENFGPASIALDELRRRVNRGEDLEAWLRMPAPGAPGALGDDDPPAQVKVVGDAHVLLALAKDIALQEALIEAFGAEDALTLLSLAVYQSGEARALYLAEAWLEERELPAAMKLEFTASLDRDFYSRANLRDLLKGDLQFTIGAPYSVKQARQLVSKHRRALESSKRSLLFAGRVLRHLQDAWVLEMGAGE